MDAEQCRRRAEYFLACADQMTDPKDKAAFQDMAAHWTRMADEVERNERKEIKPK